jgi:hypothetical protein
VEFTYWLTGAGWARARIADDDASATFTASYLTDALGDLLGAVWSLLEGATEARLSWCEEPAEHRWIFVREADSVPLRVLGFPDVEAAEPNARGATVFETRQGMTALAAAIAAGASVVLARHGEAGYEVEWAQAPFPTDRRALIRKRLAAR